MKEKIILVTANTGGGIVQFTVQIYHTLIELGYAVKVCAPVEAQSTCIAEVSECDRLLYHKEKKVMDKRPYKNIARRLANEAVDYVWYCDDSIVCTEVGRHLRNKSIKQLLTLHDAGNVHPTNNKSLRMKLMCKYARLLNRSFYKQIYKFILLSKESLKIFSDNYPRYAKSAVFMNLGAHIPGCFEQRPPEFNAAVEGGYLLFFGRIDKYKGLAGLLEVYSKVSDFALPLIIAGTGLLSPKEKALCEQTKNILVINRFLTDGEMKWLFAKSTAVLLPYIEATQSGVIPIAYAYGKPVVVSDLPGLTQFVIHGKTGIICKKAEDWETAIEIYSADNADIDRKSIIEYYSDVMDWRTNIERLFAEIY